eukprot:scaffold11159_cov79-Isochrysis_galbana.AAC.1
MYIRPDRWGSGGELWGCCERASGGCLPRWLLARRTGDWRALHTRTQPLHTCTRPERLFPGQPQAAFPFHALTPAPDARPWRWGRSESAFFERAQRQALPPPREAPALRGPARSSFYFRTHLRSQAQPVPGSSSDPTHRGKAWKRSSACCTNHTQDWEAVAGTSSSAATPSRFPPHH